MLAELPAAKAWPGSSALHGRRWSSCARNSARRRGRDGLPAEAEGAVDRHRRRPRQRHRASNCLLRTYAGKGSQVQILISPTVKKVFAAQSLRGALFAICGRGFGASTTFADSFTSGQLAPDVVVPCLVACSLSVVGPGRCCSGALDRLRGRCGDGYPERRCSPACGHARGADLSDWVCVRGRSCTKSRPCSSLRSCG